MDNLDVEQDQTPPISPPPIEPPAQPPIFCTLGLGIRETIVTYDALRTAFQTWSNQDADNGGMMKMLTEIMCSIKPASVQAAKMIAAGQQQPGPTRDLPTDSVPQSV